MEILRFALLGLGAGGAYALAAQGIVLIYKGSGTVNFAHGALGMVAGFVAYEELAEALPVGLAMAGGVGAAAALGLLQYLLVVRRLRRSSAIARLIGTLGVLLLVQAAATLRYGGQTRIVQTPFPRRSYEVMPEVTISLDRLVLFGTAIAVTLLLTLVFRFTMFGKSTTAAAENEVALAALGWSPERIAVVNWTAGGALAGLAGVLIVPIGGLQITTLTILVITAIAAAVVGRFESFWLALLAGLGIGVSESLIGRYGTDVPGAGRAVPLLVIVGVLVVSGRSLPLRGYVADRLPSVGSGTAPMWLVVAAPLAALAMIWTAPVTWIDAMTSSMLMTLLLLSIVLLTGYGGQVSLAQYGLAGVGAFVAGRLVAETSLGFEAAAAVAVLTATTVGAFFALPAVRTRGVSLAIVTLALGVTFHAVVFTNYEWTGGLDGTTVGETRLFGLDVDAVRHPARYATLVLAAVVVSGVFVSRIRRSALGHRLLALRADERAAAAIGVHVPRTKLIVFALSASLAATSGVLTGFRSRAIVYGGFDIFGSVFAVAFAVIGGVGYIAGAMGGGIFASGGLGARTLEAVGDLGRYIDLVAAATLIMTLLARPDGLLARQRRLRPSPGGEAAAVDRAPLREDAVARRESHTLTVEGLTVRYGGVHAVRNVDLRVGSGEIVGLIGPNGAGKTSVVDAVTGLTRASSGRIRLDDVDLGRLPPHARARAGLGRSFQGLGLFDDLTVRENLDAAAWSAGFGSGLRSFLRSSTRTDTGHRMAMDCLDTLGTPDLSQRSETLPLAERRICGIARALATSPAIVILDEPAAGLDDHEVEQLGDLLRRLTREWNLGVLLIEHHVGLVMSVCARVYVLESGSIIASGTPAEVADDPRVIDAYLGAGAAGVAPAQPPTVALPARSL